MKQIDSHNLTISILKREIKHSNFSLFEHLIHHKLDSYHLAKSWLPLSSLTCLLKRTQLSSLTIALDIIHKMGNIHKLHCLSQCSIKWASFSTVCLLFDEFFYHVLPLRIIMGPLYAGPRPLFNPDILVLDLDYPSLSHNLLFLCGNV